MKTSEQEDLEFRIEEYNEFYRIGQPRISDEAYDKLIEELKQKFPTSILLKKGVIEQKVSRKEKLPIPMYSLEKCKSLEEINKWFLSNYISGEEFAVITPKYDGISLVVNEANKNCWTRGDGEVGQNSKFHFNKLRGSSCNYINVLTFGEAIMSKEHFQMYKDEFANPRNMVAGLFNRDITTTPLQHVDYIRYGSDSSILDKNEQLVKLNDLNVVQVPFRIIQLKNINKLLLEDLYSIWSIDYNIDGLVIDINSSKLRHRLGREENMNPKYARAYKNPEWSGSAEVKVKGVTWQVSKQGKLKPVIQIEPTEVSGVVISNVTGYNAAYVFDNHIASESVIKIIRSGDVIPKHIETLSFDKFKMYMLDQEIKYCPCCGERTRRDEIEVYCTNPECRDKKIAKLVHFFSTMEIEEFGEPSIIRLYNAGYETIEDILNISVRELCEIEGFAKKSAVNLFNQFDKLGNAGKPFAQILDSLDLMEGKLGQKTIQLIIDNTEIGDWVKLDKLIQIHGIAESSAITFIKGMDEYWKSRYELTLPIACTYLQTPKQEVVGDKFKDQRICFTGCRPTKEQEKEIQAQGGEIVSGVSNKTTMLVVKSMDEKILSSSKAVKAKELGIKIITLNNL